MKGDPTVTLEEDKPNRRILLAGVGDLNTAVGLRLHSQGYQVIGVRRSPERRALPFRVLQRDLATVVPSALPEVDSVVVAVTADSSDAQGYSHAYRAVLQGLVAALPQPPRRLIFVSSTSVLGEHRGEIVTEDTEPNPSSETARVLLAAEQDARELFRGALILRSAGIYGPGRTRTISRITQGKSADHSRLTNRIHRDDLVTAITTVLRLADIPPLLHAVDREPATVGQVLTYLAGQMGVPVPDDNGTGTPSGKRIDGSPLHELLGQQGLRYPTFREGYSELLRERGTPADSAAPNAQ